MIPATVSLVRHFIKYTDYPFVTTFVFIVIRRELCDLVLEKEGSDNYFNK